MRGKARTVGMKARLPGSWMPQMNAAKMAPDWREPVELLPKSSNAAMKGTRATGRALAVADRGTPGGKIRSGFSVDFSAPGSKKSGPVATTARYEANGTLFRLPRALKKK